MKAALSDDRIRTASATPSGLPKRLSGMASTMARRFSGGHSALISVSMACGATPFTLIPKGAELACQGLGQGVHPGLRRARSPGPR